MNTQEAEAPAVMSPSFLYQLDTKQTHSRSYISLGARLVGYYRCIFFRMHNQKMSRACCHREMHCQLENILQPDTAVTFSLIAPACTANSIFHCLLHPRGSALSIPLSSSQPTITEFVKFFFFSTFYSVTLSQVSRNQYQFLSTEYLDVTLLD